MAALSPHAERPAPGIPPAAWENAPHVCDNPAEKRRRRREFGVFLCLCLIALLWLLRPHGELVEAERITWRLEIEVERPQQETSSDWCRDLPASVPITGRRLAEHPDGGQLERCQYGSTAWRTPGWPTTG